MEIENLDELHQYFNDISSRLGSIADRTDNSVFGVQREISYLNETLQTTNFLLQVLLILNTLLVVYLVWNNWKGKRDAREKKN